MSNKTILVTSEENDGYITNYTATDVEKTYTKLKNKASYFKRNRSFNINDFEISFNPFISASIPIFNYIYSLDDSTDYLEINKVRENFVDKINHFNDKANEYEVIETEILVTRYILCTFVDEIVNSTHFGKQHDWANNSLLSLFHNETYGGENFFHLLDKFLKTPAKYIHILELMYVCLALGFEGKYRVMSKGKIELNILKESLFKQIMIVQGREPLTFYTKQEASKQKFRLFDKLSYPLLILIIFTLLTIIYTTLSISLSSQNNDFINILQEDIKQINFINNKDLK
ncbi:type VI secretion system protein ImpK [Malaciobacter marinus]|jgi:type VI secretion system protein ImpK|uniref:Type VI secretion system protein ImpK n=1 Tax=Malaciobacter marinus TaxID=505249 RepID=A0AB36ZWD0_9BACT|nr:type IVB secretion system protein IcmH/DotU [Malaciobacter marinus]PPK61322.1 type VI secretion system protein ImpK [Malaciobacter marinus]SKB66497.1 type VI secretion system protein ImpK [Malaciobacter marinus]